jgi:large subunit ribosomal protein L29
MSPDERTKRIGELRTELVRLQTMIRAGGTVENPARVKQLRKALARLLTIQNEEKIGITKPKPKPKEKPKEKKKQEEKKQEKKEKKRTEKKKK